MEIDAITWLLQWTKRKITANGRLGQGRTIKRLRVMKKNFVGEGGGTVFLPRSSYFMHLLAKILVVFLVVKKGGGGVHII